MARNTENFNASSHDNEDEDTELKSLLGINLEKAVGLKQKGLRRAPSEIEQIRREGLKEINTILQTYKTSAVNRRRYFTAPENIPDYQGYFSEYCHSYAHSVIEAVWSAFGAMRKQDASPAALFDKEILETTNLQDANPEDGRVLALKDTVTLLENLEPHDAHTSTRNWFITRYSEKLAKTLEKITLIKIANDVRSLLNIYADGYNVDEAISVAAFMANAAAAVEEAEKSAEISDNTP